MFLMTFPAAHPRSREDQIPVAIPNVAESEPAGICFPIFMCQARLMMRRHQSQQGRKNEWKYPDEQPASGAAACGMPCSPSWPRLISKTLLHVRPRPPGSAVRPRSQKPCPSMPAPVFPLFLDFEAGSPLPCLGICPDLHQQAEMTPSSSSLLTRSAGGV